ncbi:hypothetical protein UO65_4992 [Actinokineospora spheciospongiae]|uniref:Uncharacterized protein n=1 Tax=Actinokineospora spheciospongiae TaxID=909613 RepID=W7ISJ6_9PSEU|nr:hypothetical protein [Actinokineospora spheciospongiae]EWC59687.1 hypothetical protein UO65_4992 [Actinokineospora spheciospongiae]
MRAALFTLGLAALAWGGYLAWDFAHASFRDAWQGAAFFIGGPLVHDAVVAPVVGGAAYLLTRLLPPTWHAPVKAAATCTALLAILAVPLIWHPFGVPTNPGLHDRDHWAGLGIAVAAVWVAAAAAGLVNGWRRSEQPPNQSKQGAPTEMEA